MFVHPGLKTFGAPRSCAAPRTSLAATELHQLDHQPDEHDDEHRDAKRQCCGILVIYIYHILTAGR